MSLADRINNKCLVCDKIIRDRTNLGQAKYCKECSKSYRKEYSKIYARYYQRELRRKKKDEKDNTLG